MPQKNLSRTPWWKRVWYLFLLRACLTNGEACESGPMGEERFRGRDGSLYGVRFCPVCNTSQTVTCYAKTWKMKLWTYDLGKGDRLPGVVIQHPWWSSSLSFLLFFLPVCLVLVQRLQAVLRKKEAFILAGSANLPLLLQTHRRVLQRPPTRAQREDLQVRAASSHA